MAAGRYFEAHEALEASWLRATELEKQALKGLIHAAVALLHHQRGNRHGARVKHASCRRYLEPLGATVLGVDIQALLARLDRDLGRLHPAADDGNGPENTR